MSLVRITVLGVVSADLENPKLEPKQILVNPAEVRWVEESDIFDRQKTTIYLKDKSIYCPLSLDKVEAVLNEKRIEWGPK